MKFNKSHFWYTKSQRNGILFLALLILVIQGVIVGMKFIPVTENSFNSAITAKIQHEIDSLKTAKSQNQKVVNIRPFNPSYLSDAKGYKLGMKPEEIDRVLTHRAQGKFINSATEFQQISKISDSLLKTIQPLFKFPDWITKKSKLPLTQNSNEKPVDVTTLQTKTSIEDLNTADATALTRIRGIGEKLAQRIINYRTKLGGFTIEAQLYEVYYLDPEVAERVLKQFKILSPPKIEQVNLNSATFKEVLSIVYIDYELTKKIFNYRDEIAEYQSLEELKNIEGFPIDKFDRIALYLRVK